jgi:nitrite reductase/ring-hydroxylating ferredoxin subunit
MSDEFERALDRLAQDESPRIELEHLGEDERRMVHMAQLIRGSRGGEMRPDFAGELRERMAAQPRVISRRAAFLSGAGALAAGLLAGIGLDRFSRGASPASTGPRQALVGKDGKWFPVAQVADLPHGAVKAFRAGAVQGFLINNHGTVRALSRICTHMGCSLNFEGGEQSFVCPCHGAEFDLQGQSRYGPGGYRQTLPPLPAISVRVRDGTIHVWSV